MALGFADTVDDLPAPLMVPTTELLPDQMSFLNAYMTAGTLVGAAKLSRINRFYHYTWKKDDPNYLAAFELADAAVCDDLVGVARERGRGYEYEVLGKDGEVVSLKRFSDNLLMFAIKGMRAGQSHRDNHKDAGITINVNGSDRVQFNFDQFRNLLK